MEHRSAIATSSARETFPAVCRCVTRDIAGILSPIAAARFQHADGCHGFRAAQAICCLDPSTATAAFGSFLAPACVPSLRAAALLCSIKGAGRQLKPAHKHTQSAQPSYDTTNQSFPKIGVCEQRPNRPRISEMAAMMGGDFVEAYVLKNAYKEKLRRMEAAAEQQQGSGGSAEINKKAPGSRAGGSRGGGGLFGLMKKKVHPKAAASSEAAGGASS